MMMGQDAGKGVAVPQAVRPLAGRILRDPLTLFLAIAAALFAGYWALGRRAATIAVSAQTQVGLVADYRLAAGHAPDAGERRRLIDDYVADEVLFREALARGLHLTDPVIKARLVKRLRFVIAGAPAAPDEAALRRFYASHGDLYRSEPQISLSQVFFAKMPAAPAAILAALNRGERIDGDAFWMGRRFADYGESVLRGMFGPAVLAAAQTATPGVWTGPYASPRGVHYLKIERRNPAVQLRYADVRDQVRQDLVAAESNAAIAAAVKQMEAKYHVVVEG